MFLMSLRPVRGKAVIRKRKNEDQSDSLPTLINTSYDLRKEIYPKRREQMMPGLPELLIILVIVLFIFGPKRLKNIASGLGDAIKGFRKAVTDEKKESDASSFNNVLDEKVIDTSDLESQSETQKTENT